MRRGRRRESHLNAFGEWIRQQRHKSTTPSPYPKQMLDFVLNSRQKEILSSLIEDETLRKLYYRETPHNFRVIIKDDGATVWDMTLAGYSYDPIYVEYRDFIAAFPRLATEAQTQSAVTTSATLVYHKLMELDAIRPLAHIYWTWPNAARECFNGIPTPRRMRQGAVRFPVTQELENELAKLKMIYSAQLEKGESK